MRILFLTRYSRLGASSRLRSLQYIPYLQQQGFHVDTQSFFDDSDLKKFYQTGKHSLTSIAKSYLKRIKTLLNTRNYDLIWIEKEALPWLPTSIERHLLKNKHYALDFDDAVFHNYDQHNYKLVRKLLGKRIDILMHRAALVTAGNSYLARRAITARAPQVEIIPTAIDLERYAQKTDYASTGNILRIVWIGSPYTMRYLQQIQPALAQLHQCKPFKLRIIAGSPLSLDGVDTEFFPWSENNEAEHIRTADVGIMPLLDTPWEQGKCGYKLIQYMACGLPVVASPVGVNTDLVQSDIGLLANSQAEWVTALEMLLKNTTLRRQLGQTGRQRVEEHYCIQKTAPCLANLFIQIIQQ